MDEPCESRPNCIQHCSKKKKKKLIKRIGLSLTMFFNYITNPEFFKSSKFSK